MSANSPIEWTDATWSPLRVRVRKDAAEIARAEGYTSLIQIAEKMAGHVGQHCEHVSDGCKLCYSGTNQARCLPSNGTGLPFDRRSRDLVEPFVDEKVLSQPLRWKQPKRIFVENQSDLFGEWYTDEMILRVFCEMGIADRHTYQVLTKRVQRMAALMPRIWTALDGELPNVWLGVSVENQATADERITMLLQTPAAKRFVIYEPALRPVSFERWTETGLECGFCNKWAGVEEQAIPAGPEDDPGFECPNCGEMCMPTPLDELMGGRSGIDWVIVGGESGPGARPFNVAWARNTIAQCREAGVACFVKQLGANPIVHIQDLDRNPFARGDGITVNVPLKDRKGGDPSEWPEDLRVRQFPTTEAIQHG
jgi:protein gp37